MKLGLTYNVKKEFEDATPLEIKNKASENLINENLIQNYPERVDDTFAEWDSMETIDAIKVALEFGDNEVELIEADDDAFYKLKNYKPDLVFNVAEGFYGASRESQIPSMLEMLNIPYTGSDSISIGICHDKSRSKEILSYYNVPNAPFLISRKSLKNIKGDFPKFVKPLHEGSSKGIYNSSVVNNIEELNKEIERISDSYSQPALIEDFLPGKEFTISMLGNGDDVKVLPVIEINLDEVPEGFNKIYSYEVKWFFDTRENQLDIFRCPADISLELYSEIEDVCKQAFNCLRLKDWSRIDVRLDKNGVPNIVEINPLPGILPDPADNSCFPKAAREIGLNYNQMINEVLNEAKKRYNLK